MWAPKLGAALAVTAALLVVSPVAAAAAAAAPPVTRQDTGVPLREPASDQCLTPDEYRGTTPSELPGYRSCFHYARHGDGTATVAAANVPNHAVSNDSANPLCYVAKTFTLPAPVKGSVNRRVPQRGPLGVAANGVYLFGPSEANSGNAVSGTGQQGIMVDCAGHPQLTGIWHYHHPDIGCTGYPSPDTLVGWAFDGFPIYGPLAGTKADVDAVMDDCNGVDADDAIGYRYHVRTRDQVDETLPTNDGPNGTDNWAYFLGCYRGVASVTEFDAVDDTTVCVSELVATPAPTAAAATATAAPPAAAAPSTAPPPPPSSPPAGTAAPASATPATTETRGRPHGGRSRPHHHRDGPRRDDGDCRRGRYDD